MSGLTAVDLQALSRLLDKAPDLALAERSLDLRDASAAPSPQGTGSCVRNAEMLTLDGDACQSSFVFQWGGSAAMPTSMVRRGPVRQARRRR